VDFLYSLGAGNSLVRVRGLSLSPDAPRQNLRVSVTLVGSYQKKVPVRAAAVPAATAAATNSPARKAPTPATNSASSQKLPAVPPPSSKP
jgi:hypothetical protein